MHSDTNSFASAENGIIKSDKVYEVMLATDRAHFSRCNPYMDSPQSIGMRAHVIIHASQHSL